MRVDEDNKVVYIPVEATLQEIAEFLNRFPEGEYEIMIENEFDEDRDIEW